MLVLEGVRSEVEVAELEVPAAMVVQMDSVALPVVFF